MKRLIFIQIATRGPGRGGEEVAGEGVGDVAGEAAGHYPVNSLKTL